jgi:putative hydrolase of the HAD superfamily
VTPSVVLFDLGGVLVELDATEMAALAGLDREAFARRWLRCPWVRDYERGRIPTEAFAQGIAAAWPFRDGPSGFLEAFARWPQGLFPGTETLVADLRRRVRVACLSNTNPLHWARQGPEWGLDRLADARFLSFEIGHVKPDEAAFRHVLDALAVPPGEVLFHDDSPPNVAAARALGIDAETVRGLPEAATALRRRGLLGGSLP